MPDPIIELELYLVRHGESRANAGLPAGDDPQAAADPFLSDRGLRQAQLLGEYYASVPFDRIIASGMNRALQTAAEAAKRQTYATLVEAHPVFTECGVGTDFGEKPFEKIRNAFPCAIPAEGADPNGNFIFTQNSPSDELRMARAKESLRYLRERFHNGERVMLVAHANFNTFFVFAALGLSTHEIFDIAFANTGVTKLVFYKEGTGLWGADTHLIYHNDRSHLANEFPDDLVTKL